MPDAHGHAPLNDTEAQLVALARAARDHAYAPYSHFAVGAAVRAGQTPRPPENADAHDDDSDANSGTRTTSSASGAVLPQHTFIGCNVENASFGLTICAERNAVFQAVAAGIRQIDAVAVVTDAPTPTMPCGACRQVLREFGPDMVVIGATISGKVARYRLGELLPASFGPEDLPGA
jgi:cytidine deaminase